MAITYEAYKNGKSNIKFYSGHVLGWIVSDYENNVERLYALSENGEVKCTRWLSLPNTYFNKTGRTWHVVSGSVPDMAVFCGHYNMN